MKEFLARIGAYIAGLKPYIETFFAGLGGALLDAAISAITNNPTWDWNTLKAALVAAFVNYITSKSRYEAAKKQVAVPVDPGNNQ